MPDIHVPLPEFLYLARFRLSSPRLFSSLFRLH